MKIWEVLKKTNNNNVQTSLYKSYKADVKLKTLELFNTYKPTIKET